MLGEAHRLLGGGEGRVGGLAQQRPSADGLIWQVHVDLAGVSACRRCIARRLAVCLAADLKYAYMGACARWRLPADGGWQAQAGLHKGVGP